MNISHGSTCLETANFHLRSQLALTSNRGDLEATWYPRLEDAIRIVFSCSIPHPLDVFLPVAAERVLRGVAVVQISEPDIPINRLCIRFDFLHRLYVHRVDGLS